MCETIEGNCPRFPLPTTLWRCFRLRPAASLHRHSSRTRRDHIPEDLSRYRTEPIPASRQDRMSELETLERTLLADIDAAGDEGSIETVRVNALGKKGSISELLKTLGT